MVKITLKDILKDKQCEIEKRKTRESIGVLKGKIKSLPPVRNFKKAISVRGKLMAIAEIKKKSPSAGLITKLDYIGTYRKRTYAIGRRPILLDVTTIARQYEANNHCCAISVLTNKKYFGGDIKFLNEVKDVTTKPVLRKDFIIDEYQVYESRVYGADCILLISAILSRKKLNRLFDIARGLGLRCLIESHYREDLTKVPAQAEIYGINNRDLAGGFSIDLEVSKKLIKHIPAGKIIVVESGIKTKKDINFIRSLRRVNAVLIGTSILKEPHPGKALDTLLS